MGSGAGSFLKVILKNFDVLAGYVFLLLLYFLPICFLNWRILIFWFGFRTDIHIMLLKSLKSVFLKKKKLFIEKKGAKFNKFLKPKLM